MKYSFLAFFVLVCTVLYEVIGENILSAGDDSSSGECGENITWVFDDQSRRLIIKGYGEMFDFSEHSVPWNHFKEYIREVVFEGSITKIGRYAFYDFKAMLFMDIPNGVTSVGEYSFGYCDSLTRVTLPKSLRTIGHSAFYYCKGLTSIIVPDGVKSIQNSTFFYCDNLVDVVLPVSLSSIGDNSFNHCVKLTSIVIPDGVQTLGYQAFYGSGLKSVVIPENVSFIGDHAFYSCEDLKHFFYQGEGIQTVGDNVFSILHVFENVCVPPGVNLSGFLRPTDSHEACKNFTKMFSTCHKGSYVNGIVVQEDKRFVKEMKSHSTDCIMYECNDSIGTIMTTCDGTSETSLLCQDGKCVDKWYQDEKQWSINFEINGTNAVDLDIDDILGIISVRCELDPSALGAGWESDGKGNIIRVIIFVDDKQTADKIAATFADCANEQTTNTTTQTSSSTSTSTA